MGGRGGCWPGWPRASGAAGWPPRRWCLPRSASPSPAQRQAPRAPERPRRGDRIGRGHAVHDLAASWLARDGGVPVRRVAAQRRACRARTGRLPPGPGPGGAAVLGWRLLIASGRARWQPELAADAPLAATLLFLIPSPVLSPQYLLWVTGLAAACLATGRTTQRPVALAVLAAAGLTQVIFPVGWPSLLAGSGAVTCVLAARNGLLVVAAALSCQRILRATSPGGEDPSASTAGPPRRSAPQAGRQAPREDRASIVCLPAIGTPRGTAVLPGLQHPSSRSPCHRLARLSPGLPGGPGRRPLGVVLASSGPGSCRGWRRACRWPCPGLCAGKLATPGCLAHTVRPQGHGWETACTQPHLAHRSASAPSRCPCTPVVLPP